MSATAKFLLFLGDLLFLNCAILSSSLLGEGIDRVSDNIYLLIFSNLSWLYLTLVSNPYNLTKGWSLSKALRIQLVFIFIHLLVVASLISFLGKKYSFSQIGFIYLVFVPVFFLWKICIFYLRKIFTKEVLVKNYVIIGRNHISAEIRGYFLSNPSLGYRFLGYIELNREEALVEKVRFFNSTNEIHEIYYCSKEMAISQLKPLIDFGLDSLIKVKVVVESQAAQGQIAARSDRFDQEPGQNISLIALDDLGNQLIKRLFDVVFSSAFLLLVMSWLLPIIFVLIKMDSKGPVFFRQLRSGKDNKPFNCLKFRSMKVNLDSDKLQATKDDPRITKLGAFLRKSSIDELPQFINVFLGSMSVVGPRPHMLKHTEEYSKLIEKFMGRHYVKPGITGLAQCMGYRGETRTLADMENRVRLDRYYIENWTFWLDIKIIFLTVVSLIRGSDKAF